MVLSPAWTRDELILACDLVVQNDWRELRPGDRRVVELSDLLRSLPIHPPVTRPDSFRTANSVSRKTTDIATGRPGYVGKPTRGGKLDKIVLQDFLDAPAEMHAVAHVIRKAAAAGSFDDAVAAEAYAIDDVDSAREGRLITALRTRRERDPKLRRKKIDEFLRDNDRVFCEVCNFDFEAAYGVRGKGYIECHHVVPLHVSGETNTRTADLVLVCANCHRMIHQPPRWIQPNELRDLVMAHNR
ncbi:HNH endonuclease [Nocardia tengchongensis]|uniref:HNH endonuclease n=1 Tax=Nocardia tengchongensis TaxID=2055889 RepID=UPI0036109910